MARSRWHVVERWQARSEMGVLELRLLHVAASNSDAWRVEWLQRNGYRKGVTFTGAGRETRARGELDRRKTKYIRVWQLVAHAQALR